MTTNYRKEVELAAQEIEDGCFHGNEYVANRVRGITRRVVEAAALRTLAEPLPILGPDALLFVAETLNLIHDSIDADRDIENNLWVLRELASRFEVYGSNGYGIYNPVEFN